MDKKPRVLTISKPYVAAAYRRKLALLVDQGFEVGLICPPKWGAQEFEPWSGDQRLRVTQVPIVLNGKNHLHLYEPSALGRAVRAFAPDIVNAEEEHYSLVTAQLFHQARLVGAAPLFYTWQNLAKRYPPPFSLVEKWVFRNAAAAVVGNHEAGDILRRKGYRGLMAEIPQMGVDVELFAPPAKASGQPAWRRERRRELGLPQADCVVGFVGRIVPEKGLETLLEALAATRPKLGHATALAAVVIGNGPDRSRLMTLASSLGIDSQVTFLSGVSSEAIADYLQAIDVLCLPSRTRANWKEQFGRILIEAMAAEALVIGSDSGEIPRVIGDGGLVFPEGHAATLADLLTGVARGALPVAELRQRAAVRVRQYFSNEVIATQLGALCRQVMVESGKKSVGNQP